MKIKLLFKAIFFPFLSNKEKSEISGGTESLISLFGGIVFGAIIMSLAILIIKLSYSL